MAGGPSTPELAAAVTNAGGLGFLAAGYKSPDQMTQQIRAARSLTGGPLGVNLFIVSPTDVDENGLDAYRRELQVEADRHGIELGHPRWDDDAWEAKLDVVRAERPDLVSFTFGCPSAAVLRDLDGLGILTAVTVTDAAEARTAAGNGARVLVVQGPGAGGHRATFDPAAEPGTASLPELLATIRGTTGLPLIAGGGIGTRDLAGEILDAGAVAFQVGTALLLADEAGTTPVHRSALQDPQFTGTSVTRAFTGRPARSLRNRFIDDHPTTAHAYPHIHHLTAPLRAAAAARNDPQALHLWAGTGYRRARQGPAAEIVAALAP